MFASRRIIGPVCSNFMPTLTANLFEMQFSFFLRLQWSSIQRQNRILRFRKKSKRKQNCQSVHFSKQVALGCDLKSFGNKICLVETAPQLHTHIGRKLWSAISIFFWVAMVFHSKPKQDFAFLKKVKKTTKLPKRSFFKASRAGLRF